MKFTEPFKSQSPASLSNWGHGEIKLKHKYESEFSNKIKTYKLSEEELEEYLKDVGTRARYTG